jgi:hypothetical protein
MVNTASRLSGRVAVATNFQRSGKQIKLAKGFFYNATTGLHGDQFDDDSRSPTFGQIKGNDNGDYFEWKDELLRIKDKGPYKGQRTYATWIDCPIHLNHDDKYDCGFIADAIPDFDQKSIEMVMATDMQKEADLCRKIQAGQQTDVSMGCDLMWSICSGCGNISYSDNDWCNCLIDYKGRRHPRTGRLIAEILKDVTGVELSHITFGHGADKYAKNNDILFAGEFKRAAALHRRQISKIQEYYKHVMGI